MLIAVSVRGATARIARLDGDILTEYAIWDFEKPDGVRDIHTGRVVARVPAMAGSFVDIGGQTGFLPESAAPKVTEGDYLSVIVTRAAQGGKGPRLGAASETPGEKPGLIRRGPGPLLDLAARFPAARVVIDDYGLIARLKPVLEVSYRAVTFDAVLEDEVAALAAPSAALPGGAVMHVAITPAVTAIDIDAGAATAEMADKQSAQLSLNLAILPELARQIVLRNLSGGIIVDFAGMRAKDRRKLDGPLRAALDVDPLGAKLLGFSHLGFAELSRPRIRPPLHELLT